MGYWRRRLHKESSRARSASVAPSAPQPQMRESRRDSAAAAAPFMRPTREDAPAHKRGEVKRPELKMEDTVVDSVAKKEEEEQKVR